MQSVSVLAPFRSDGGWRDRVFDWITRRYQTLYPEFELCIGTNDDEPFSRSKARNNAFREATGDILIVSDADTFCSTEAVERAIQEVASGNYPWSIPYTVYFNLAEEATLALLAGDPTVDMPEEVPESSYEHRLLTAESGVLVVSRDTWETVGGYDEGFVGWGYEDNAFVNLLHRVGIGCRIRGSAYHMYHELAQDPFHHPSIDANRARFKRTPPRLFVPRVLD